jgi:uncharacterized protein YciI
MVCSGPFVPREGGAFLIRVESAADVQQFIDADPFRQEGLASYSFVVWDPNIGREGLDSLAKPAK